MRFTMGVDVATQTATIARCDAAAQDGVVTWYLCAVECQSTRRPSGKRFPFSTEKAETTPGKRDKSVQTPRRPPGPSKKHQTPRWEKSRSMWPPAGVIPPTLHPPVQAPRRFPQAPIPPTPPPTPPIPTQASSSWPRIPTIRECTPEEYVPLPLNPTARPPPEYKPTPIQELSEEDLSISFKELLKLTRQMAQPPPQPINPLPPTPPSTP